MSSELITIADMSFRSLPRARSLSGRGSMQRSLISRETLRIDGLQVSVLRKKNRNMYLRVKPPYGAIEVTAPVRMPQQTIEEFVRERRTWIEKALQKMAAARSRTFASPSVDLEVPTSSVIAREENGVLSDKSNDSSQSEGGFLGREAGTSEREKSFTWNEQYARQARESIEKQLPDLLRKWEPIVGRSASKITIRTMSSRWGSCTPKTARIRLNLQLGLMDSKFLEYVLVHELVHLWEHGHGAGFQARMSDALPQWKELRRELNRCTIMATSEVQK